MWSSRRNCSAPSQSRDQATGPSSRKTIMKPKEELLKKKNGYGQVWTSARRKFAFRQYPYTSVVITVTFVAIFTCIIAMEVLFIDQNTRVSAWGKVMDPEAGAPLDSDGASERKPPLQAGGASIGGEMADAKSRAFLLDMKFEQGLAGQQPGRSLHQDSRSDSSARSGSTWLSVNRTFAAGDWQPVVGAREKFYVYSAYLDLRQGRFVRVIGATRTRGHDKVNCIYWYGGSEPPVSVTAAIKAIRENWNLKYSAIFVLCPLFLYNLGQALPVPDEVSVVIATGGQRHPIGNRLEVLNRNTSAAAATANGNSAPAEGFAVCVKPLHYNFNRALLLIEFIELNRILGVQHFVFYNHTIGHEVACVLRDYARQGLVTLLPWQQLDMVSQKEIRTEGLFAALNDCVYRNMHRYRYLLMIDIDEYIVPHRNATLPAMMREFHRKVDPAKAGSFSFMNSFFYLQWPNDPNSRELPPLVTLQKTKRRSKFHPHKQRSKCIIVARYVVEMGNHFVWEFLPGKGAVNVPPEIAFVHHYRVCEFGGNDCVKTQSVTDRTIYRYKSELVQRVLKRIDLSESHGVDHSPECQGLNLNVTRT